jgi:hypothetical protein
MAPFTLVAPGRQRDIERKFTMQSRTVGFATSRLALALLLALAGDNVLAQDTKAEDHTAHHPADTATAAKTASTPAQAQPAATDKGSMEKMEQMDAKMKAMKEMREKLMMSKTPDERMALMPAHMKIMQESMAMMDQMRAGSMADKGGMGMMAKHKMMEKRMDMMESMMQMMMDRIQAPATK